MSASLASGFKVSARFCNVLLGRQYGFLGVSFGWGILCDIVACEFVFVKMRLFWNFGL